MVEQDITYEVIMYIENKKYPQNIGVHNMLYNMRLYEQYKWTGGVYYFMVTGWHGYGY